MSLQPRFSIITVTYNAAEVIEPTLQSVAVQTYKNYEHLLIDGASTDDTLARAIASGISFSHIVSEKDKGLYDAMNKGISLATGDYLCFLNAGDALYAPDTLERMVAALDGMNELPDVLYGETAEVDDERRFMRMRRLQAPENLTWKSFKQGMLVCHQAFFVRRDKAPFYDLKYRFSADVDWCIRVMKNSKRLVNTHTIIVNYLQNGLSLQNHRASLLERYDIMCKHYGVVSTFFYHVWFVLRALIKK